MRQRDTELKDMQSRLRNTEAKLDELLLSRDQQIGEMGQYKKELANVRAKLKAKESELDAAHLRLADAEKGWTSLDELVVQYPVTNRLDNMKRNLQTCVPSSRRRSPNWRQWQTNYAPRLLQVP